MHKSDTYGKIKLRVLPQQNERQNEKLAELFAEQVVKHLPYKVAEISAAIVELLTENVLRIEFIGEPECCFLFQKRMVKDNELSIKRSESGKKGADKTNSNFAAAKQSPNSENENEYKGDDEIKLLEGSNLSPKMLSIYKQAYPLTTIDLDNDFRHCVEIAKRIAKTKGWQIGSVVNGKMDETLDVWSKVVSFTAKDNWFSTRTLQDLAKHNEWERLVKAMAAKPKKEESKQQPTAPPLKRY